MEQKNCRTVAVASTLELDEPALLIRTSHLLPFYPFLDLAFGFVLGREFAIAYAQLQEVGHGKFMRQLQQPIDRSALPDADIVRLCRLGDGLAEVEVLAIEVIVH